MQSASTTSVHKTFKIDSNSPSKDEKFLNKLKLSSTEISAYGTEFSIAQVQLLVDFLKNDTEFKKVSILYFTVNADDKLEDPRRLEAIATASFADIFRYNSSITHFKISGHYITDTDRVFSAFGNALKHNCVLQHLDLYAVTLNTRAIAALAEGITVNRTLEKLTLGQNLSLEESDLNILVAAIHINPFVEIVFDDSLLEKAGARSRALLIEIQAKSNQNHTNRLAMVSAATDPTIKLYAENPMLNAQQPPNNNYKNFNLR